MKSTLAVASLLILLAGCSQPEYLRVLNQERAQTNAMTDVEERWLRTIAEGTYLVEQGARPFDVVLAEERQKHNESNRLAREYVETQSELKRQLAESQQGLYETLARIENEKQQRRWKQEMLLRDLKVGDSYPWESEIGYADRRIDLEDGSTVHVFELKETVGTNTTVTVDTGGNVINITRYP